MGQEELIARITAEVMKRLAQTGPEVEAKTVGKVLALITGGTIGLDTGLEQLQELQNAGLEISVVLSPAAERVVGTERVLKALGSQVRVITADMTFPGKELREAALVVVPVLTQNTAAKLAQTIADGLAPTLIMQAMLMGKPVVAAANAADPKDGWRIKAQMGKGAPALQQALRMNLKRLDEFGMTLVKVEELAAQCFQRIGLAAGNSNEEKSAKTMSGKKVVVDAAMIQGVAATGQRQLRLASGALVTPLARDIARQQGIELIG